ncbi:ankyrin repeat-containing domain protein, partial [Baffinella frigidus]
MRPRCVAGVVVWYFVVLRSTAAMGQSFECTICLETMKRSVCLVPCGHSNCERCVTQLEHSLCPACRTPIQLTIPNWEIRCAVNDTSSSTEDSEEEIPARQASMSVTRPGPGEVPATFSNGGAYVGHDDMMEDGWQPLTDFTGVSIPSDYQYQEGVRKLLRAEEGHWDEVDFYEAVIGASARGHVAILQELLDWRAEHGPREPLFRQGFGSSPLVHAAARGHGEIVRRLLASGANASEVDDDFCSTALFEAAAHGYAGIVGELLSSGGADVNSGHQDGSTAVSVAAQNGHAHVVEILLVHLNNTESTPMMLEPALRSAVERNDLQMVSRLLNAGASTESGDGDGNASVERHGCRVLINLAAAHGNAAILTELVMHGANVNSQSWGHGMTPLIIACQNRNEDAARVLIECGANVSHTRDRKHPYTALMATDRGPIVRLLLQAGADPNQRNAAGIPPLFQAAMRGDVEVVEELGRGGAELDGCVVSGDLEYSNPIGRDEHTGRCPLWIAVRHHHVGVVQALVRLGADVSKRSAGTARGDMSVGTPLLLAADVCDASELTEDSTSAAINVFRLLLEAGASPNKTLKERFQSSDGRWVTRETGMTPLHTAVQRGSLPAVILLIAKGADVRKVTADNETPLSFAASSAHPVTLEQALVHALIAAGADVPGRQGEEWRG